MVISKLFKGVRFAVVFSAIVFASGAAPEPLLQPAVEGGESASLHYKIYRKGKSIGDHYVSLAQADSGAQIDIRFQIRVKFLGITAFKMDHEATETWTLEPLTLNAMSAVTDRSSGTFHVRVDADEDGYEIDVNGDKREAPESFVPTSFVLARHLFDEDSKEVILLDTLSGILRPSRIDFRAVKSAKKFPSAVGVVRYYEITRLDNGEVSHRIWYDESDAFLQVGLTTKDGHYVEYRRQA